MIGKPFEYIEKQLRKKSFGVISTIDSKGRPHSTGVIYTIAPKPNPFHFYIVTGVEYRKAKYIEANPNVAFMVTFPHYWLRFVPANVVHFQGKADILPFEDSIGRESFMQNRISRMNLNTETDDEIIFIRIKPSKKLNVYGLGIH
ncbi:MAG: pyridoxamine 5'-phosphate oxidase family protein [Candidatus Thorarchaeota archaeon]|nr:pyridoxamine 5'-phosphate oxidase family protein [Candidatus Thorarchaeota archaeon]